MPVVHGNKIQAHTRVRRAEIVQAAKPCAKRSLFYGERKKKKYAKEQETRKVTESAHVRRERARQRGTEKELSASR